MNTGTRSNHVGSGEVRADSLPAGDVRLAYNRWAVQYDNDRNTTRDLDAEVLRAAGLHLDRRTVLEIGCGTGKNTEWIAEYASQLIAMDFSEGMLAVAQQRVSKHSVRFIQHDVRERWPIENDSVETIIGNLVLEHVHDLRPVYAEAARVLRPGGELYFCELHPFRQWRGGQAHFTEQATGQLIQVDAHVHSVGDYINAAIGAGFVLQHVGEWLEADAPAKSPPRLISVRFTIAKPS
ncbi:MAG: class I SAM-dependent methyltransferase [Phycisphaerae bacterium]|nr:class I SAM-dependent methyltransferase [Gemmatimonadaceae bacterium]